MPKKFRCSHSGVVAIKSRALVTQGAEELFVVLTPVKFSLGPSSAVGKSAKNGMKLGSLSSLCFFFFFALSIFLFSPVFFPTAEPGARLS